MTEDDFIRAAWDGELQTVKSWLEQGRNIEARSSWSNCGPLIAPDQTVFNFLLEHGADPLADYAPLASQVWEVCPDNVDTLLALGADPSGLGMQSAPHFTAETALHSACSKPSQQPERLRMIKALIAHGADVNAKTKFGVPTGSFWRDVKTVGETPLHRAAAYCSEEIIDFLLASGADRSIRDDRGESAQSWASRHWRDRALVLKLAPDA